MGGSIAAIIIINELDYSLLMKLVLSDRLTHAIVAQTVLQQVGMPGRTSARSA